MCHSVTITIRTTVRQMRHEHSWDPKNHAQDRPNAGAHGVLRSRQDARSSRRSSVDWRTCSRNPSLGICGNATVSLFCPTGLSYGILTSRWMTSILSMITQRIKGFGVNGILNTLLSCMMINRSGAILII